MNVEAVQARSHIDDSACDLDRSAILLSESDDAASVSLLLGILEGALGIKGLVRSLSGAIFAEVAISIVGRQWLLNNRFDMLNLLVDMLSLSGNDFVRNLRGSIVVDRRSPLIGLSLSLSLGLSLDLCLSLDLSLDLNLGLSLNLGLNLSLGLSLKLGAKSGKSKDCKSSESGHF